MHTSTSTIPLALCLTTSILLCALIGCSGRSDSLQDDQLADEAAKRITYLGKAEELSDSVRMQAIKRLSQYCNQLPDQIVVPAIPKQWGISLSGQGNNYNLYEKVNALRMNAGKAQLASSKLQTYTPEESPHLPITTTSINVSNLDNKSETLLKTLWILVHTPYQRTNTRGLRGRPRGSRTQYLRLLVSYNNRTYIHPSVSNNLPIEKNDLCNYECILQLSDDIIKEVKNENNQSKLDGGDSRTDSTTNLQSILSPSNDNWPDQLRVHALTDINNKADKNNFTSLVTAWKTPKSSYISNLCPGQENDSWAISKDRLHFCAQLIDAIANKKKSDIKSLMTRYPLAGQWAYADLAELAPKVLAEAAISRIQNSVRNPIWTKSAGYQTTWPMAMAMDPIRLREYARSIPPTASQHPLLPMAITALKDEPQQVMLRLPTLLDKLGNINYYRARIILFTLVPAQDPTRFNHPSIDKKLDDLWNTYLKDPNWYLEHHLENVLLSRSRQWDASVFAYTIDPSRRDIIEPSYERMETLGKFIDYNTSFAEEARRRIDSACVRIDKNYLDRRLLLAWYYDLPRTRARLLPENANEELQALWKAWRSKPSYRKAQALLTLERRGWSIRSKGHAMIVHWLKHWEESLAVLSQRELEVLHQQLGENGEKYKTSKLKIRRQAMSTLNRYLHSDNK